MAVRRMFSISIVDSDVFLDLPPGAQNLYFHLNLRADDDGFVNNPRMVMRIVGAQEEDLAALLERGFLLSFDNGVVAVTHWRVHNRIRKDRYVPTRYREQLSRLSLLPDGAYAELPGPPEDPWQPDGNQTATQVRLG